MDIHIEIIPHNNHRSVYINPVTGNSTTVGDWWVDEGGVIQVRASQMKNVLHSCLIVIHELTEVLLEGIKRSGHLHVPLTLVNDTDEFDKAHEARRPSEMSDPGLEPDCPVYEGHMAASAIEMIAAMILRVNYNDYADEVASL